MIQLCNIRSLRGTSWRLWTVVGFVQWRRFGSSRHSPRSCLPIRPNMAGVFGHKGKVFSLIKIPPYRYSSRVAAEARNPVSMGLWWGSIDTVCMQAERDTNTSDAPMQAAERGGGVLYCTLYCSQTKKTAKQIFSQARVVFSDAAPQGGRH